MFPTPPPDGRFIFKSGCIRANVKPVSHTCATVPAARALEQAAVQALRGVVEARWHGDGRSKRKGPPRVKKRAAKRGERSVFYSFNDTILDLLHTRYIYMYFISVGERIRERDFEPLTNTRYLV